MPLPESKSSVDLFCRSAAFHARQRSAATWLRRPFSLCASVSQWFPSPLQHHTLDSLMQSWDVKVQDEPGMNARQAQIRQELGFMDRQNPVHGF